MSGYDERKAVDDYRERQEQIREAIKASPVVGTCGECSGEIRAEEIEQGLASLKLCARCTYDEVISMIGDYD